MQDTRTPVRVATLCLIINAVLNFILMFPLKIGGIALASSISGLINYLILFNLMKKRLGGFSHSLFIYLLKVIFAGIVTAVVVYFSWNYFSFRYEFVKLFVLGFLGLVFYQMVCLTLGVAQAKKIGQWIFQRR